MLAAQGETSGGADGSRFVEYLKAHRAEVDPIHLYRAVAKTAIAAVMQDHSRLSMRGFGVGSPRRKDDGTRESPVEVHSTFVRDRQELLQDHGADEFLLSLALARQVKPTKTVRPGTGSYRLKHIAEAMPFKCADGTVLGPRSVANGAFIAAALFAGFKMQTYVDASGCEAPNVNFNMSKQCVDDLDCKYRPTSAVAERRRWLASRRQGI
jgi:hypothetical protein